MTKHLILKDEAVKYRRQQDPARDKGFYSLYTDRQLEQAFIAGAKLVKELYDNKLKEVYSNEVEIVRNTEQLKAAVNNLLR